MFFYIYNILSYSQMYVQDEAIVLKQLKAYLQTVTENFFCPFLLKYIHVLLQQSQAPPLPLALCNQGKQTLMCKW